MRKVVTIICTVTLVVIFGCNPKDSPDDRKDNRDKVEGELDIYNNCPLEGNAKRADIIELNRLKNRYTFPTKSQVDTSITLKNLLKEGNDESRWNTGKAVQLIGYVSEVVKGGVETCNCKTKDELFRDTHIEIVQNPMSATYSKPLIAEVTPRLRYIMSQKGIDWSTKALRTDIKGRWVKITGWLLFDDEHADEADNTAPGRERNWRKTAWEIHPVTSIEIVQKPH